MAGTNALINTVSAVVIYLAVQAIRAQDVGAHRRYMLWAAGLQALFLAIYLTKAILYGTTPFVGDPSLRVLYLIILAAHTVAATVTAPLVLVALVLGLRRRHRAHRRVARWAYPIWFFTSVTGPITFLLLYGFGRPGFGVQAAVMGLLGGCPGIPA